MSTRSRWRALLRRLGIGGESRWITDAAERETHRSTVRRRLRRSAPDEPSPPPEDVAARGEG